MKHARLRYQWTCPYCRLKQYAYAHVTIQNKDIWPENDVAYCDTEQGGCDKRVAIVTKLELIATPYKIAEGE